ncbi:UPF0481 protein At3g47200-like [Alnus glutinosa]|uniref:UPF0481 protein At3g47200-like n=1 Tax=Alnus glutinosa TaxID=3517 RepID=UPI002D7A3999|nr:UPF0481 protein At3g47200-like [Alnus glutinosa]
MDPAVLGEDSHILAVAGEEDDGVGLVHKMYEQMREIPVLPPAVGKNHCIFKLPPSFKSGIDKSYKEPQKISIGPYHKIDNQINIKWQCLEYLLQKNEPNLKRYIESLRPLEQQIRECYSEEIDLSTDDFLQMMVLDGCFILEWLCFTCTVGRHMEDVSDRHPLAQIDRVILLKIYPVDLLLLENQIPFFVPEKLFEVSKMTLKGIDLSLSSIGAEVFSAILGIQPSEEHHSRFREVKYCLHLVDIVRSIFVPHDVLMYPDFPYPSQPEFRRTTFDIIPRMSKLRRAGINVSPRKKDSLLMVEFRDGVIEMPKIILNDLMCSFLINCVAFEQRHNNRSLDLSVYALFLSCLVKNAEDVEYLCEHRVMDNYIETDSTSFIENLGKGIATDPGSFINNLDKHEGFLEGKLYFFSLCSRVNLYYQNRFHWQWTNFKAEYFDKPWTWISVFAALVLFVLSFLQTYYTMHPRR